MPSLPSAVPTWRVTRLLRGARPAARGTRTSAASRGSRARPWVLSAARARPSDLGSGNRLASEAGQPCPAMPGSERIKVRRCEPGRGPCVRQTVLENQTEVYATRARVTPPPGPGGGAGGGTVAAGEASDGGKPPKACT